MLGQQIERPSQSGGGGFVSGEHEGNNFVANRIVTERCVFFVAGVEDERKNVFGAALFRAEKGITGDRQSEAAHFLANIQVFAGAPFGGETRGFGAHDFGVMRNLFR